MSRVPVLLITGTVGAGKTTVAFEISDVLRQREVPNAAIDLDGLTVMWPWTSKWHADLMFQNLASIWPNYQAHGATHLVLAHVLEDAAELDRYRAAVPGAEITVVRLVVPEETRKVRLRSRIPQQGARDWHLARTVELEAILAAAANEHFTVENGSRDVRNVAVEILQRAGWVQAFPRR